MTDYYYLHCTDVVSPLPQIGDRFIVVEVTLENGGASAFQTAYVVLEPVQPDRALLHYDAEPLMACGHPVSAIRRQETSAITSRLFCTICGEPLQSCGHPVSAVVTDTDMGGEGCTCYCGECAKEASKAKLP